MDIDTAKAAYREEQERRSRDRQLVLLGAMFASEGVRAKVEPRWFADAPMRDAATEMQGGGSTQKWALQTLANAIGLVEWDAKGKPSSFLGLLVKHCQTDAELQERLFEVVRTFEVCERSAHGTLADKTDALERAKRLTSEAFGAARQAATNGKATT